MQERGVRKTRKGVVTSNKMDNTIVVKVEGLKLHSRYQKYVKKSKKFKAHDPNNECKLGDIVEIMETRPLSKTKRWRFVKLIERPIGAADNS